MRRLTSAAHEPDQDVLHQPDQDVLHQPIGGSWLSSADTVAALDSSQKATRVAHGRSIDKGLIYSRYGHVPGAHRSQVDEAGGVAGATSDLGAQVSTRAQRSILSGCSSDAVLIYVKVRQQVQS